MKEIKLLKNRSDIGAGTRGADLGIDAIEIAAINQNHNYFSIYHHEDIETENESIYNKVKNSFAKRIGSVVNVCNRVSECVHKNIEADCYPIVVSGDHSSALGTLSGVKAAYADKKLGVIWVDAHADLHSPYTSPSGNVHGMPLAAGLSIDNKAHQINEVPAETEAHWTNLKNIGVEGKKLEASELIFFGVRDTEAPEDACMKSHDIKNYTVDEIRFRGMSICLQEAVEKLSSCDVIYISFDVDSLDCDRISKGTGTPVSRGFDIAEVVEIINTFIRTGKTACFEVVEVNPTLDTENRMAIAAFEVLKAVTPVIKEVHFS
jgi:arginase